LGGWIATRSGGHYATLFTHIDEFVEGMRVLTPRGPLETRRLPGSGAGPDGPEATRAIRLAQSGCLSGVSGTGAADSTQRLTP